MANPFYFLDGPFYSQTAKALKHGFSMVDRASRLAADETGAGLQRGVDVNAAGRSEVIGAVHAAGN